MLEGIKKGEKHETQSIENSGTWVSASEELQWLRAK